MLIKGLDLDFKGMKLMSDNMGHLSSLQNNWGQSGDKVRLGLDGTLDSQTFLSKPLPRIP